MAGPFGREVDSAEFQALLDLLSGNNATLEQLVVGGLGMQVRSSTEHCTRPRHPPVTIRGHPRALPCVARLSTPVWTASASACSAAPVTARLAGR